MAKHGHASAEHSLMRDPNSFSSFQVVGFSPPPPPPRTEKMASSSGDFFLDSGATAVASSTTTTKPLTMFYNGGVAVFHLPQDKAEDLMKMAAGEKGGGGLPGHRRANNGEEFAGQVETSRDAHCKQEIFAALLPEAKGEVVQALINRIQVDV